MKTILIRIYRIIFKKKTTAKEIMLAYEAYLEVLREEHKDNTLIAIESGFMPNESRMEDLKRLWGKINELKKGIK